MPTPDKVKRYTASAPVYLSADNRLVPAGETFSVPAATPAGAGWVPVD